MSEALENLLKIIALSQNNSTRGYQTDDQLRTEKIQLEKISKKHGKSSK